MEGLPISVKLDFWTEFLYTPFRLARTATGRRFGRHAETQPRPEGPRHSAADSENGGNHSAILRERLSGDSRSRYEADRAGQGAGREDCDERFQPEQSCAAPRCGGTEYQRACERAEAGLPARRNDEGVHPERGEGI